MLATLVVLAGNLGLILTVLWTLWDSSAINQIVLLGTAVGAATLVLAYTVRSMRRTLKIGMARLKRQQEEIGATEAAQPELVGPQFRQSRIAAMP